MRVNSRQLSSSFVPGFIPTDDIVSKMFLCVSFSALAVVVGLYCFFCSFVCFQKQVLFIYLWFYSL